MSKLSIYRISADGNIRSIDTIANALAQKKADSYLWLDYHQAGREDLESLVEPFGLHPLSIEDCVDANQIPKIEDYDRNTFIIFNALIYSNGELHVDEVNLCIGAEFLLSVSGKNAPHFDPLADIERIVKQHIESVRKGPSFLLHVLMDFLVDRKFDAVEAIGDELDAAEEVMMADLSRSKPEILMDMRRNLLAVRKALFHEREILLKICRRDCSYIPEPAIYHFRDIYDHLTRFFELAESYRETVTSLREMYLTMLNNQMTRASNETNLSVRRLTIITTIFMPLTLLAGIGGMSEWSMMTGPDNWHIAYPAFFLLMLVIGVANYIFIHWLEKKSPNH